MSHQDSYDLESLTDSEAYAAIDARLRSRKTDTENLKVCNKDTLSAPQTNNIKENAQYKARVYAQIDRLANRLKALVTKTDYININRATRIFKTVHDELDHSKLIKQIRTQSIKVQDTVKQIPAMHKYIVPPKKQDETPEVIYADKEVQLTKQSGFYTLLDKSSKKTTNIKILGDDYSNSYIPWRQCATNNATSNVKHIIDKLVQHNDFQTPNIVIPSGEGKTTLVKQFNRRNTSKIDSHTLVVVPPIEKDDKIAPIDNIIDYDTIPHIEAGITALNAPTSQQLDKINYNITSIVDKYCTTGRLLLTHTDFSSLTGIKPAATVILPNPTYQNLNIASRYLLTRNNDYITATRQTRNDAIIIYSYLHQHFINRLQYKIHTFFYNSFNVFE